MLCSSGGRHLGQRSGTYGSRASHMALFKIASGSLAHRQIFVEISSKHCKTASTSRMAFQSYHWCHLQVSCSSIVHWPSQCRIRRFRGPCDTVIQLYGSRGNTLLIFLSSNVKMVLIMDIVCNYSYHSDGVCFY